MFRKILLGVGVIALTLVCLLGYALYRDQRADYGWEPNVPSPAFTTTHPHVAIDEAHNNASTAGIGGRYYPFAKLLRADGYDTQKGTNKFTPEYLATIDVLVVVNASGAPRPQFFGLNLPFGGDGDRSAPAFDADEIRAVYKWVEKGGSLLFIADHAPFGAAAAQMAEAFGVEMYRGFVEIPNEQSDPLIFSAENGRLGSHPIIEGISSTTSIRNVMTFTGQSMHGPADATTLLRLPENAIEYRPVPGAPEGSEMAEHPAGDAQGLALSVGKGRVVMLGEAAMLTAQLYDLKPFGMNQPGNDNEQFALNIMHWLSGKL